MRTVLHLGLAAVCLAGAACNGKPANQETPSETIASQPAAKPSWYGNQPASSDVAVDVNKVVDVPLTAQSSRTYFYAPGDTGHVYWYDASTPNAWSYRPVYFSGDRTYFLERDGTEVRRIWFDDAAARRVDWSRDSRWSSVQREAMLASARADWAQRESDESVWRDRWNRMHSADLAPRVDLDAVVDVPADEYLNRTYFIDVADATHVYWFDSATPASWNYRPFYRDGDHTYVLERSGTTIRRVWFDHARAKAYDLNKDSSWSIHERANMRTAARAEWTKLQREESAWRSEWEKRERAKPATTAKTGKPADQDVDVGNVSDVLADAYPNRRYFYDADDTAHVYWYDTTAPDAWSYRPVYRTGDRAYFLERDGNAVRRYYFDDAVARRFDWSRESRWDVAQRARMRDTARQAWTVLERDERGWRGRWDAKNRR